MLSIFLRIFNVLTPPRLLLCSFQLIGRDIEQMVRNPDAARSYKGILLTEYRCLPTLDSGLLDFLWKELPEECSGYLDSSGSNTFCSRACQVDHWKHGGVQAHENEWYPGWGERWWQKGAKLALAHEQNLLGRSGQKYFFPTSHFDASSASRVWYTWLRYCDNPMSISTNSRSEAHFRASFREQG